MDLAHWGFDHWPFQHSTTSDFSSAGSPHDEAMARLLFLIDERRRCGLLVGNSGTGKSCLFKQVRSYAERRGRCCVGIDLAGLTGLELALQLENELSAGHGPSSQAWSRIQDSLLNLKLVGQPLLILLDHFDLATTDVPLATIRLLNLAEATGAELTLLLASRGKLASSDLMDRIELTVELTEWSCDETTRFVQQTLQSAGAQDQIFSPSAMATIHQVTHGVPRAVVRMCDLTLLAAINDNVRLIDTPLVEGVSSELLPWH